MVRSTQPGRLASACTVSVNVSSQGVHVTVVSVLVDSKGNKKDSSYIKSVFPCIVAIYNRTRNSVA